MFWISVFSGYQCFLDSVFSELCFLNIYVLHCIFHTKCLPRLIDGIKTSEYFEVSS